MATVAGLFETREDAERAVKQLQQYGIDKGNIGVALQDKAEQQEFVDNTGVEAGAATGAVTGGLLGGGLGLILSAIGAVTIPVIGPIIAAGPIAAALTGAGVGAATGGLLGALTEAGIPQEEAQVYQTGVERGGVLVTANVAQDQVAQAQSIMQQYGMLDTGLARNAFTSEPNYRFGTGRSLRTTSTTTVYDDAPRRSRGRGPGEFTANPLNADDVGDGSQSGGTTGTAVGGGAGAIAGGVIGGVVGGPVGVAAGAAIGGAAGAGAAHVAQDEHGSNAGPEAGGATGAIVGGAIGSLAGPIGTAAGAAIGGAVGAATGDATSKAADNATTGDNVAYKPDAANYNSNDPNNPNYRNSGRSL